MHLIKKVSALEVKRNFLITHFLREQGYAKDSLEIDSKTFKKALHNAKHKVRKLSVLQLNSLIANDYSTRLEIYNSVDWYLGDVRISELGEWNKALGNNNLTSGNLENTRDQFVKFYNTKKLSRVNKRFLNGIPVISKLINIFKKDHYLYPIALESNINPDIRRGVTKTKFDLDDGNLRALTLALNGYETIRLYVGRRRV